MLKIKALNHEASSDEDGPSIRREAQEEIALEMYNKALKLLSVASLNESKEILQKLISENIPQLENHGGLPKTMSTFKYSCYINIGRISYESGELKDAIDNYLIAAELDGTDVTLWFKIGQLAIKLDRFREAAYAFSKGLECSESHWPCLDKLITLLYVSRDTIACLIYIGKALILDSYYIKGRVLQKKIYESNPATKEYYQQFNPEYYLEPNDIIPIDKEDEDKCMEEVQQLFDRVNEIERALEPQPLPTIPLPSPLTEFSWIAVGTTLIELHKYISENNMSHFCKIDLNKCMSQKMDVCEEIVEEKPANDTEIDQLTAENVEKHNSDDKIEPDPVVTTRRPSQTSENNGNDLLNDNITPVQTDDNDEADLDTEDQDENPEKITKTPNRGTKRRRDLLSDLQIWGWHSKRKQSKKGKQERDLTVEDALTRIVPVHLLRNSLTEKKYNCYDDSMNTMDLYNLYVSERQQFKSLSPIHSPRSQYSENYFGSNQEKEDVQKFWKQKFESCDVICMIEQFMFNLSKLWYLHWTRELIAVYVELYEMYREHCDHAQLDDSENNFTDIKTDSLVTILYGEICYLTNKPKVNTAFLASLTYLQQVIAFEELWADEFLPFFIRVYWLRAHFFQRDENNVMGIQSLQLVQELIAAEEDKIQEKFVLTLPNCSKYNLITMEIIEKLLKHLEMIDDLSQLEHLYEQQEYKKVADILRTTFAVAGSHPTCGRMGRPAQLAMLLHALWYTDLSECFVWTEECIFEALDHFLNPGQNFYKWKMVLQKCLCIMLEIIRSETVIVVDCLSEDKRSRLVESLARIVCHQLNSDVGAIPLGSITPWIVLHYVLVREEHRMHAKGNKHKHIKNSKPEVDRIEDEKNDVPPSIAVLFSAHRFLGPKGWCLTNQGELLHFMLDNILDRLDTPIFEMHREKIDIHIEQALFCLYQHPSKKNKVSRHLADHNVNPLPLSWERSHQLYEFYCPDRLPEFDSYKSISISSDLEQLLLRITALVPSDCDPQPVMPKMSDFIHGAVQEIPDPAYFPNKVRAMYYLLGDYYFKQNEVGRSLKYFMLDLCINPLRLDAWACIALGTASQLESKLNHCQKFKNEGEFLDKAKSAQVCFKQALRLANDHVTLWIEYGSFEYMVHSFCSRILKYESDTMSMEKFETLENLKDNYLTSSSESFQFALNLHQADQNEADERWLYHYMLAKIGEKQRKEPIEYLQHYLNAAGLLEENNAIYPDKISYTNPQHLSLEALEVHYRIHASILKYLELHEGKPILSSVGKIFKKCLNNSHLPKKNYPKAQKPADKTNGQEVSSENKAKEESIKADVTECLESMLSKIPETAAEKMETDADESHKANIPPSNMANVQEIMDALMKETMSKQPETVDDSDDMNSVTEVKAEEVKPNVQQEEQNRRKSTDTSSSSSSSSGSTSTSSESETEDTTSSSSSSSDTGGNLTEAEVVHLVERCIAGLEQCIVRLPQNYKALYRLVHLYYNYKAKKDLTKCRQLFLGEYKCKNSVVVTGLFYDRKTSNFFNGVWRIPSSEIDRPGSFAAHMGRCVALLLQVLRSGNDYKTLLDVCLQLKRIPDSDKIYIRDCERKQLAEQAMSLCIQSLKAQIKALNVANNSSVQKLLLDVHKSYQRVQKHADQKESTFAGLLTEVYAKLMHDKIPENVNVLDLAVKYCQQNKPVEKPKYVSVLSPRASALAPNVPVLPPPSTVTSQASLSLKKAASGRPRGRPPGPKLVNQGRPARGRSPNLNTGSYWQNQVYNKSAYNYMKQYHEALIRQYSKSLTMNQMSQLAQIGQYLNPTGLGNQYKMPVSSASVGGVSPGASLLSSSSLMQNIHFGAPSSSQMDASSFKKIGADISAASLVSSADVPAASHLSNLGAIPKLHPSAVSSASLGLGKSSHSTNFSALSAHMQPPRSISNSIFTMPPATSSATVTTSGYKYPTADYSNQQKSQSKVSYHQALMEAMNNLYEERKPTPPKKPDRAKTLLPNRPSISITPVTPAPIITTVSSPKYIGATLTNTSPGKTLQEKLAEKQKQLSNQHSEAREREKHAVPTHGLPNMGLPTSLTISRTSTIPSFPKESGISIREVRGQMTAPEVSKIHQREQMFMSSPQGKVGGSATRGSSDFELPPNIPLSLSVIKKRTEKNPEKKLSVADDVIVLD